MKKKMKIVKEKNVDIKLIHYPFQVCKKKNISTM
jgi:hypothetical protein